MKSVARISGALALAAAFAVEAHHSFQATFQQDETISVEGVVTEFVFRNPHILIYLDVENDDGSVTNWMSEGGSATGQRRRGWDRSTIPNGQTVRITGNSTRDGSPMVSIRTVEFLDPETRQVTATLGPRGGPGGQAAGMGAGAAAPQVVPVNLPDGRVNLTGAWVQMRGGPRSGPPEELDGVPPFSAAGEKAQAAYDRANDPQVFCEPPGLVRQAGFTPHPLKIAQHDDRVVIEYEEYGGRRVVYLGEEMPPQGDNSHLGDSVARYEGDALIIETVNLLGNPSHPWGYRFSDQTSVVEVYTRTDDERFGSVVHTETTVNDPVNLREPWVLRRDKMYSAGYEFIANDCRPPLRERQVK